MGYKDYSNTFGQALMYTIPSALRILMVSIVNYGGFIVLPIYLSTEGYVDSSDVLVFICVMGFINIALYLGNGGNNLGMFIMGLRLVKIEGPVTKILKGDDFVSFHFATIFTRWKYNDGYEAFKMLFSETHQSPAMEQEHVFYVISKQYKHVVSNKKQYKIPKTNINNKPLFKD